MFSGDLVMGWTSTFVSPPDGDLTDFRRSCRRLRDLGARALYPGHGAAVADPQTRIDWLLAHRDSREAQILDALSHGLSTPRDLTERVYTDIDPRMWPAATRNVLAHLVDLVDRGAVTVTGRMHPEATFTRASDFPIEPL